MLIADVIKTILTNLPVLFFLIAIGVTIARVRRGRLARRPVSAATTLWIELVFYYVGFTMIWAGVYHAYFASIAAPYIGWQPSPFEFELGWFEIALGVTALISRGRGVAYRTAVTIPFVIFMLAAAAQHIDQIIRLHNDAPGNAGIGVLWFGDVFSPLFIAAVALLSRGD